MASITPVEGERGRRYRVRYRSPEGGSRTKTFRTATSARDFARRIEVEKTDGLYRDSAAAREPLGEYAARLLGLDGHPCEWHDLRPSTLDVYRRQAVLHVLPTFGRTPMSKITPEAVRTWQSGLLARKVGRRTIQQARAVLHRMLAQAVADGRLHHNVVAAVKPVKAARKRIRVPTPHEVEAIAETIDPRYRAWVYTVAYAGLRFGESAGLRWENVDLPARRLRVVEQLVEVGNASHVGPPKSSAGIRWIDLPEVVADALEAHAAAFPPGPDGQVFTAADGGPLGRHVFRRRAWQGALKRAGVEGLSPHDLRHYAASMLIAGGIHPRAIMEFIGHASIRMTMDVYGHLFPTAGRELAMAMDRIRREALAAPALRPVAGGKR